MDSEHHAIIIILQVVAYCIIPLVLRFTALRKKKWTKGGTAAFVIANVIVLDLIYIIFCMATGATPQTSTAANIIGAFVGYFIMMSGKKSK